MGPADGAQRAHEGATVLDMEDSGTLARPCGRGGASTGTLSRGASGLTGGEHGGFTFNLLQLLNEQGVLHLPLQGPSLPAGTLDSGWPRGCPLLESGHGGRCRPPRLPGPGALGGPSASPRGQRKPPASPPRHGAALADGRVPTPSGPGLGSCPAQALASIPHRHRSPPHTSCRWQPSRQARACGHPRGRSCSGLLFCRRLTPGAAAAWLLPGWGLRGGARAGRCHIASLPLRARVLQAQDQSGKVLWPGF